MHSCAKMGNFKMLVGLIGPKAL